MNKVVNKKDIWFQKAYKEIPKILKEVKVATDRELKVRLEGEPFPGPPGPFPWVTARAIEALLKENIIKRHGYRGRRRIGKEVPSKFYALTGTPYSEIETLIQKKRRISADINNVLMGRAPASYHAEDLFMEAFDKLDFTIHGRDVSEFRGRKTSGVEGKRPPDLDFIVERDGVIYGVDVKNWIRYEYPTRDKVYHKVKLAEELGVVPFIIARYLDRDTTNKIIYHHHGLVYEYKKLILPSTMRSLAEDAERLLGYPTLAVDNLPDYMVKKIEDIHLRFIRKRNHF